MTSPQVLTIDLPEEINSRVGRVEFEAVGKDSDRQAMTRLYYMRMYPPGEDATHLMRVVPALYVDGAVDPLPIRSSLRKLYVDKIVRIIDQATIENPMFSQD